MDANNTPQPQTPSTLRFITDLLLIVEIGNSLREWRQSIRGDDPVSRRNERAQMGESRTPQGGRLPRSRRRRVTTESASNSSVSLDTVSGARASRLLERIS